MSREDLQQLAVSFFEAFNDGDWKRYEAIIAPNATYDEKGTGRKANNRRGCVAILRGFKISTPALQAEPSRLVIDEIVSIVAVDTTWWRTDTDDDTTVPGTYFFAVQDQRITHIREQHFFYMSPEWPWPPGCPLCLRHDGVYEPRYPNSPIK